MPASFRYSFVPFVVSHAVAKEFRAIAQYRTVPTNMELVEEPAALLILLHLYIVMLFYRFILDLNASFALSFKVISPLCIKKTGMCWLISTFF